MSATAAAPSLRPRPEPKASPQRIFRDLTAADLQRLELRIFEGARTNIEGARAVISWDHHQVLDTFRSFCKEGGFQRQVTGSILKKLGFTCCGRPYSVSHSARKPLCTCHIATRSSQSRTLLRALQINRKYRGH